MNFLRSAIQSISSFLGQAFTVFKSAPPPTPAPYVDHGAKIALRQAHEDAAKAHAIAAASEEKARLAEEKAREETIKARVAAEQASKAVQEKAQEEAKLAKAEAEKAAAAALQQAHAAVAAAEAKAREAEIKAKQAEENARKAIEAAEEVKRTAEKVAEANYLRKQTEAMSAVTSNDLILEARTRMGIDCQKHYNWVISGISGAGKSTTINAILGYATGSAEAAKVGVSETTMEVSSYLNPEYPSLRLWDIPGCGTETHPVFHPTDPKFHYYRRFSIFAFDAVLVLYSTRLGQGPTYLVQTCYDAGQPVVIVRTKADEDVISLMEDGLAVDEKEAEDVLRKAMEKELSNSLKDLYPKIPKYLVSMRNFRRGNIKYDEARLIEFLAQTARARAEV